MEEAISDVIWGSCRRGEAPGDSAWMRFCDVWNDERMGGVCAKARVMARRESFRVSAIGGRAYFSVRKGRQHRE